MSQLCQVIETKVHKHKKVESGGMSKVHAKQVLHGVEGGIREIVK